MITDEKYIKDFIAKQDYDIRKTHNGRFMDQKCIPDVVCAVAECVVEYINANPNIKFSKDDIWHSDYSRQLLDDSFRKPDTENESMSSEYDKFFAQPLKLFAAANILSERKQGVQNLYSVKEKGILEYISLREKNALTFLDLYLTKTMVDSGCMPYFEDFFQKQDKNSLNALKDKLTSLYKNYTNVKKEFEPPRIYNKIINILAFRRKKCGTIRGFLSHSPLTIDEIRYNRVNWRDVEKPKTLSRTEYAQQLGNELQGCSGYYERSIEKAKRFVRELEQYSEVHHYPAYMATDAHHIFMKSDFPELADMPENIIALTGTEHYTYAHPNRNTQRTDPNYQMICLICKLDSIERNFQQGNNDYSLEDFTKVLNEGLDTDFFNVQMGYEGIKAHLLRYLRPIL